MKRVITILLLLAACSGEQPATTTTTAAQKPKTPPPPSATAARDLIAGSAEFGDYQFTNAAVSIPVSGTTMNEPARATAKELAKAGWVKLDGSGNLSLTAKSENDKRFLLRDNGILDIVPLAKKEMGDVTSVRANSDGTAAAEFTWKWVPNEVGSAITSGPVHDRYSAPQKSTATLIWDGNGWSVLQIE